MLRRRLRCYDGFVWYELGPVELPKYFPLVLCDGPAVLRDRGETFYGGWRYGILPVLSSRSITFGAMLADDADDARAPAILKRWCREFGLTARIIRSSDGAYAVLMPSGA